MQETTSILRRGPQAKRIIKVSPPKKRTSEEASRRTILTRTKTKMVATMTKSKAMPRHNYEATSSTLRPTTLRLPADLMPIDHGIRRLQKQPAHQQVNAKSRVLLASKVKTLQSNVLSLPGVLGPNNSHPNADRVKTFSTSVFEATTHFGEAQSACAEAPSENPYMIVYQQNRPPTRSNVRCRWTTRIDLLLPARLVTTITKIIAS